jgi:hypothetical protein
MRKNAWLIALLFAGALAVVAQKPDSQPSTAQPPQPAPAQPVDRARPPQPMEPVDRAQPAQPMPVQQAPIGTAAPGTRTGPDEGPGRRVGPPTAVPPSVSGTPGRRVGPPSTPLARRTTVPTPIGSPVLTTPTAIP